MRPGIPRRLRGAGLWVIDDHILMTSIIGENRWAVVGGGVEPGESAYEACEREFREEVGVDVRCQRLAIVGDITIRPNDRVEQDLCFYFLVTPVRGGRGMPAVTSHEPGVQVAWLPVDELGWFALVPPSLDTLIPRALTSDTPLYATYDCRTHPDEHSGTRIWP